MGVARVRLRPLLLAVALGTSAQAAPDADQEEEAANWVSRFAFVPPPVATTSICVPSGRPLPMFTVTPTAAGRQLVCMSLPFEPGTFPAPLGLAVHANGEEIVPDVRPLTYHPGQPASVRRAMITFVHDFADAGTQRFHLTLRPRPSAAAREVKTAGELRASIGITGSRIAICPPKGSYQDIVTEFNERIMHIAGMENALWFWTRWPAADHLAQARSIGLKAKPAWWHNWLRLYVLHWYIEPVSMMVSWHAPSYETLSDAGHYVDVVMPWGGNAWGPHYMIPSIGWWGWSPEGHDWQAMRSSMYDIVFGPGPVATPMTFGDTLVRIGA